VDYSVREVRAFAIENALHWLDHYRFDGLRLDAVHAITLPGEPSLLVDLSRAVGELARRTGRLIHLMLENDDNTTLPLDPVTDPPAGRYRAQWNDDYHHAWHTFLTGEARGYYKDYVGGEARHLPRIMAAGFAYQGEPSLHRGGVRRGEPSHDLPPTAFVSFLQNHDQVGNRARGERLETLVARERIEAALAVTLLAPFPPMLFMGEEWGATQPFAFFCDFSGDLADAVRNGRRAEFAEDFAHQADAGPVPDPLDERTFRDAVLDWTAPHRSPHRERLDLVRRLLAVRRAEVVPHLGGALKGRARSAMTDGLLTASWPLAGGTLQVLANLCDRTQTCARLPGRTIWGEPVSDRVQPWSVHWSWQE
jgi:malto-oligosyltrehalose trehalohydrolase